MTRRRRTGLLALLVLTGAFLGLGVSEVRRDTTPPRLYLDVARRAEVGDAVALAVSADEPVTYVVRYGDQRYERVTQDLALSLTAVSGATPVHVRATDGSGNATETTVTLMGLAAPAPHVQAARSVQAGDPLGVRLAWPSDSAAVEDVAVTFDGRTVRVLRVDHGAKAIVPVPLGTPVGAYVLDVRVTDEFGRLHRETRDVAVREPPHPVEQLHLKPSTLALVTPEAQRLERDTLARVEAAAAPDPLWTAPFERPIEGVPSAGFGSARRYAPGGPVSYHTGLDLAAPQGTPIHATNDGTVVVAGDYPIKGGLVVLDHGGGVFSLYFHQSEIRVQVGEHVRRGQVVGLVGTTGLSTGPHLHWEMQVDGVPTNPLAWVDRTFP